MPDVLYGRSPKGQFVYDFGFSTLTDKWLARKYGMPLASVRILRARVRIAVGTVRPKKKR